MLYYLVKLKWDFPDFYIFIKLKRNWSARRSSVFSLSPNLHCLLPAFVISLLMRYCNLLPHFQSPLSFPTLHLSALNHLNEVNSFSNQWCLIIVIWHPQRQIGGMVFPIRAHVYMCVCVCIHREGRYTRRCYERMQ